MTLKQFTADVNTRLKKAKYDGTVTVVSMKFWHADGITPAAAAKMLIQDIESEHRAGAAMRQHLADTGEYARPLTLKKFTAAVNKRLLTIGYRLTAYALKPYHDHGMTPEETVNKLIFEAESRYSDEGEISHVYADES